MTLLTEPAPRAAPESPPPPPPSRADRGDHGPTPWTAEDLVRWFLAAALGGVLVVVGWYLAAGQASDARQVGPLDLAIGGVVLAGIANLTWLVRGWHAVGERRKALVARLPTDVPVTPHHDVDNETAPVGIGPLVGEGARYFHRPSCPLAVGRNWPPAPLEEHLRAGREPCGVCRP